MPGESVFDREHPVKSFGLVHNFLCDSTQHLIRDICNPVNTAKDKEPFKTKLASHEVSLRTSYRQYRQVVELELFSHYDETASKVEEALEVLTTRMTVSGLTSIERYSARLALLKAVPTTSLSGDKSTYQHLDELVGSIARDGRAMYKGALEIVKLRDDIPNTTSPLSQEDVEHSVPDFTDKFPENCSLHLDETQGTTDLITDKTLHHRWGWFEYSAKATRAVLKGLRGEEAFWTGEADEIVTHDDAVDSFTRADQGSAKELEDENEQANE